MPPKQRDANVLRALALLEQDGWYKSPALAAAVKPKEISHD